MRQINVVILGSTGSIGVNALKVISHLKDRFRVVGLTAYNNKEKIAEQIREFQPDHVAVTSPVRSYLQAQGLAKDVRLMDVESEESLEELVSLESVDIVLIAMRGSAALKPFLKAVRCGKIVAPANKEALVVAGELLMSEAQKYQAKVIPIDSEQSAIYQCLEGQDHSAVKRVILTASGGALRTVEKEKFSELTKNEILRHPRWKMGKKITVDSATLMNKGFEVIEAKRLFGLGPDQIEVVVHPQAIIHSMVEFVDHSILAQMGIADMRLPIQYALTYPERIASSTEPLDLQMWNNLTFEEPDLERFPSLSLCFEVLRQDGSLPSVLNAADEEVVEAFLKDQIRFIDIYPMVEKVVRNHQVIKDPSLDQILESDQWAREEARRLMNLEESSRGSTAR